MDWEAVKLVGAVIGVATGVLTLSEKLVGYAKRTYQYFKKNHNPRMLAVTVDNKWQSLKKVGMRGPRIKKEGAARPTPALIKKSDPSLAFARQAQSYRLLTGKDVRSVIQAHELAHATIPLKKCY